MKRIICLSLVLVLLCALLIPVNAAESDDTVANLLAATAYYYARQTTGVYQAASTTSTRIDEVVSKDRLALSPYDSNWYYRSQGSLSGYITASAIVPRSVVYRVTGTLVNNRSGAGRGYSSYGLMNQNDFVQYLGTVYDGGSSWYRVRPFADSRTLNTGYIRSDYLTNVA